MKSYREQADKWPKEIDEEAVPLVYAEYLLTSRLDPSTRPESLAEAQQFVSEWEDWLPQARQLGKKTRPQFVRFPMRAKMLLELNAALAVQKGDFAVTVHGLDCRN